MAPLEMYISIADKHVSRLGKPNQWQKLVRIPSYGMVEELVDGVHIPLYFHFASIL